MKLWSTVVVAIAVLGLCLSGCRSSPLPSILWVVADDLGYTDLAYKGGEFPTPTLDALAQGGVRLSNYYVQLVCSPTRTSFMTGRYPIHTGLQHIVIWQDVDAAIDKEHPTVAEVLKRWNYSTHMIGKWHNGHASWDDGPLGRGFDTWYGWNGGSSDYYTHMIDAQMTKGHNGFAMFNGSLGWDSTPIPAWSAKGTYSTDLWTTRAVDVIFKHDFDSADPFFLYLAYQAPHAPVQAAPDPMLLEKCTNLTKGSGRDVYCTMVSRLDQKLADVIAAMKAKQAWSNTLFIFTTDNGGCMPTENRGCNAPLRGGKHHLFEGGVRGEGFVFSELFSDAVRGSVSWNLMHAVDWFPTILAAISEVVGEEPPVIPGLDGVSQWATLRNSSNLNITNLSAYSPRTEIPHNIDPLLKASNGEFQGALRLGNFKLVVGDLDIGWLSCNMSLEKPPPNQGLNGTYMLFDLATDPTERHDLSGSLEHRDQLNTMLARYAFWKNETVPPNYPTTDPHSYPELNTGVYAGAWKPWIGTPPKG